MLAWMRLYESLCLTACWVVWCCLWAVGLLRQTSTQPTTARLRAKSCRLANLVTRVISPIRCITVRPNMAELRKPKLGTTHLDPIQSPPRNPYAVTDTQSKQQPLLKESRVSEDAKQTGKEPQKKPPKQKKKKFELTEVQRNSYIRQAFDVFDKDGTGAHASVAHTWLQQLANIFSRRCHRLVICARFLASASIRTNQGRNEEDDCTSGQG